MNGLERNYIQIDVDTDPEDAPTPAPLVVEQKKTEKPEPVKKKPILKASNIFQSSNAFGGAQPKKNSQIFITKKRPNESPSTLPPSKKTKRQKTTRESFRKNNNLRIVNKLFDHKEDDIVLSGGFRLPKDIFDKLFEHQQTSVKWLWELYCSETGGIIADEMVHNSFPSPFPPSSSSLLSTSSPHLLTTTSFLLFFCGSCSITNPGWVSFFFGSPSPLISIMNPSRLLYFPIPMGIHFYI